jgi:hypothetical protein
MGADITPSDVFSYERAVGKPAAWVYRRLTRLTSKPVIACEFGTIDDPHQAEWTKAALSDLLAGRWPGVIGFSRWNAAFRNDPVTGRWSNMRVEESPRASGYLPPLRRPGADCNWPADYASRHLKRAVANAQAVLFSELAARLPTKVLLKTDYFPIGLILEPCS